jgi:hypothetical protein
MGDPGDGSLRFDGLPADVGALCRTPPRLFWIHFRRRRESPRAGLQLSLASVSGS